MTDKTAYELLPLDSPTQKEERITLETIGMTRVLQNKKAKNFTCGPCVTIIRRYFYINFAPFFRLCLAYKS